jgi:hypothetical protein
MDTKDSKDSNKRKFEQQTHSGTSSMGSMGAGGTGQSGIKGSTGPGNSQSAGRTDDLLSGGVSDEQCAEGFQKGNKAEDLRPGLTRGGSDSGKNRQ